MSFDETKLIVWMDQTDKRLAHLEANQAAIINGDYWSPEAEPKEPLIKDEKICRIFRDWCVANGLDNGKFRYSNNGILRSTVDDNYSIWFVQLALHVRLKDGMEYTFDELCGASPEPIEPTFIDLDERIKEKEEG